MGNTTIKVALLGAGNVGSQVARMLTEDAESLQDRIGAPVELIGIAVRDTSAKRHYEAAPELYTTDADALQALYEKTEHPFLAHLLEQ